MGYVCTVIECLFRIAQTSRVRETRDKTQKPRPARPPAARGGAAKSEEQGTRRSPATRASSRHRTGLRPLDRAHGPTTVTVTGSTRDPPRPHAHTDQTQECRCALGCPRPRSTHRIFGAVPADRTHSITSPCALTHKLTRTKSRTDPDYVGFHISDVQLKMASRTLMPTPQDVVTRPTNRRFYEYLAYVCRCICRCRVGPRPRCLRPATRAPRTCNHSNTK